MECNAYCKPEEGIHTYIDRSSSGSLDEMKEYYQRSPWHIHDVDDSSCLPHNTYVECLDMIEASEIPPEDPWPFSYLVTVRILK